MVRIARQIGRFDFQPSPPGVGARSFEKTLTCPFLLRDDFGGRKGGPGLVRASVLWGFEAVYKVHSAATFTYDDPVVLVHADVGEASRKLAAGYALERGFFALPLCPGIPVPGLATPAAQAGVASDVALPCSGAILYTVRGTVNPAAASLATLRLWVEVIQEDFGSAAISQAGGVVLAPPGGQIMTPGGG